MNALALGEKRRWVIASFAALIVVAVILSLFRAPSASLRLPQAPVAEARPAATETLPVQLAQPTRADSLLRDVMALRDLQPLFLPTEHNAAFAAPRLEPGRTFLENETPKLSYPEADLNLVHALPSPVTINGRPAEAATTVDALEDRTSGPSLEGFGRSKVTVAPVNPRGACIEVFSASSGERLWGGLLPVDAKPPGDKPWAPLELLAMADRSGLTVPLVVTDGSRVEEVDNHFRVYLARVFRIGERLAPGTYRIVVAP